MVRNDKTAGSTNLFLGKYPCKLDGKNRLLIPSPYRKQITGGVYITQGFDRNLLVLTTSAFEAIYRRVMSLNIADPLARLLLRLILGAACEAGIDGTGHIRIPPELRDFAQIGESNLIIGQGDYFEVWALDQWKLQETQIRDAEANAARFSALTVATR